ncbi:MAG: AsnC family transcriptional regulator [Candidatus Micrarchaeota archaeon]|nr:AsnC family transcriptional regulator [Candidatus Micrarchaeota archaeon]
MPPIKKKSSLRYLVSSFEQSTLPKIDAIDRKIIYELEQNCRRSLNEIAKNVRVSKQTLHYRIVRLVSERVITQFVAILDVSKLGLVNHEVWVQLEVLPEDKKNQFIEFLIAHNATRWVASCGGKIDLVFAIAAENTVKFNIILTGILSKYPNYIKNYFVTITLEYLTYPRSHMINESENSSYSYIGGEPKRTNLDEIEIGILSILSKDARKSTVELAKELDITENTVRAKIKLLEKDKIIQTYSAIVQPSMLGLTHFEILATTSNMTKEKEKEIETYCLFNPFVTYYLKLIGKYDIDVAFDAVNQEHFQKILVEFRSRFSSIIKDFDFVYITYVHKFDYFAGFEVD